MSSNYDNWKTTQTEDKAWNYAQDQIENLSEEEVVKKALERRVFKGRIYEIIYEALFNSFVDEYEGGER